MEKGRVSIFLLGFKGDRSYSNNIVLPLKEKVLCYSKVKLLLEFCNDKIKAVTIIRNLTPLPAPSRILAKTQKLQRKNSHKKLCFSSCHNFFPSFTHAMVCIRSRPLSNPLLVHFVPIAPLLSLFKFSHLCFRDKLQDPISFHVRSATSRRKRGGMLLHPLQQSLGASYRLKAGK